MAVAGDGEKNPIASERRIKYLICKSSFLAMRTEQEKAFQQGVEYASYFFHIWTNYGNNTKLIN